MIALRKLWVNDTLQLTARPPPLAPSLPPSLASSPLAVAKLSIVVVAAAVAVVVVVVVVVVALIPDRGGIQPVTEGGSY